jgi:DNA-binding transcriptional MerR regulator
MAKFATDTAEPSDRFIALDAARLSGLSLSMVNYLCRTGIVTPTGGTKRGHGRIRHYTFGDVVALRLVAKLSATGVSPLRMKKGLQGLRKHHPEITLTSLPGSHVVTNGKELYLRQEGQPIERAFDGQFAFAFVVELAPLQREVAASVLKLLKTIPSAKAA